MKKNKNLKTRSLKKEIENKVKQTIKKYKLLNNKDKILVALSGGKDSTSVLYILKKIGYNVSALHINLGLGSYSEGCLEKAREACKKFNIKLYIMDIKKIFGIRMCYIRQGIQKKINVSNCLVCGIVKKWLLNKEARILGFDKIVTGHNLDDEAQTVIMNFLQGNLLIGINSGPVTGSLEDKKFIPRIKPLFFVPEKNIRKYSKIMNLPVVYEKCPCAISSLRIKTRAFLENKDNKLKEKIVSNFLKILPELRKKFLNYNKRIIYCRMCGEPSRNEICKKCQLLNINKIK